MINKLLAKVFGTSNERAVKRLKPILDEINRHEEPLSQLSDEQLAAKTVEFRDFIAQAIEGIEDPEAIAEAEKKALDTLLPEAFAVVREAGKRVVKMRHFDVQMIGGMVLHSGKIAEMKTGEGKTLVATLPCYLNALAGHGVHVVTVNDYLAKRDAEWMGKIYGFLGLSVGVIVHDLSDDQRRAAYASDITYGTNNEFGFDYLRDNMKFELAEQVQRGNFYCIVDEVDSILIDEARTPLIISGPTDKTTDKYAIANKIIPQIEEGEMIENFESQSKTWTGDYVIDEKARAITVTDEGWERIEKLLGIGNIAEPENWDMKHHIEVAIKAHALYKRDVEYVVKDGEVIIVDEFTGRLMPGRRWADGLHQAVEAKEGVDIRKEDQTLATITFQNYFRLYKKLSGMTGTAETEAAEFDKIYKLEIVVIPTNRQMLRIENSDVVYRTEVEKYHAVADEIERLHAERQPVLVGTTSIEKSERLSGILQKKGVHHYVLNAKFHEKEAEIVAQAGRIGMVTIATNMAGRGTDILLGGNAEFMAKQDLVKAKTARSISVAEGAIHPVAAPGFVRFYYQSQEFEVTEPQWDEAMAKHTAATKTEHDAVIEAGGLHILGTERHESRRVDNQLRGRAGRQGDPGSSRFFLSLEDDLMRIFAREWVSGLLQSLGMEEGVPIESRMISRRIESAQKAVESQNFESRKHVLEYDDVMNKQREAVYSLRRQLMEGVAQKELIVEDYVSTILSNILDEFAPPKALPAQWNTTQIESAVSEIFGVQIEGAMDFEQISRHELGDTVYDLILARYAEQETLFAAAFGTEEWFRSQERYTMLRVLDGLWKEHLLNMDHLKEGIGLRGYAQQDPLVAYKKESYEMFGAMMLRFQEDTCRHLFWMQILGPDQRPIENLAQLNALRSPVPPPPTLPPGFSHLGSETTFSNGNGGSAPAVPTASHKTTVDAIEREFERNKKRDLEAARHTGGAAVATQRRISNEVGRNDPCPCGSGKKYKKCHGAAM